MFGCLLLTWEGQVPVPDRKGGDAVVAAQVWAVDSILRSLLGTRMYILRKCVSTASPTWARFQVKSLSICGELDT